MDAVVIPLSLLVEIERVLDEARKALHSSHDQASTQAGARCAWTSGKVAAHIAANTEAQPVAEVAP